MSEPTVNETTSTQPTPITRRRDAAITRAIDAVTEACVAADEVDADDSGGWAMAPDALAFVERLVTVLAPDHVVEFGSGVSTVTLAGAVTGDGRVTSIDNDPVAAEVTRSALVDADLTDTARVLFAPLVARRVDGRHLPVYHLEPAVVATLPTPGVVLVDGPPSMLGGREGSLCQALDLAGPGNVIVLDDAARDAETTQLEAVAGRYRKNVVVLDTPGYARGLGVLVVTDAVEVAFDQSGGTSGAEPHAGTESDAAGEA